MMHVKQAWILARTQTLSQASIDARTAYLKSVVPEYDVDSLWIDTKQGGDCVYNAYNPTADIYP
jgi:hypothetical protein